MATPDIRLRTWVRGSEDDVRTGLLGYLSLFYGGLILDGITVRRTAEGRITLSFPTRTSRRGQRHAIVRPIDDDSRREIEREILGRLAQQEAEL